jgi:hypothetical protein
MLKFCCVSSEELREAALGLAEAHLPTQENASMKVRIFALATTLAVIAVAIGYGRGHNSTGVF